MNNSKIHYIIAGKGDKEMYLMELAKKLNVNLHLLGYRTDVVELLNTADIYAFPSYREGLSVALMEALAAGLPCVVSEIRGNVDLIKNEKGGFLCKPDDVNAFYNGIKKLSNKQMRLDMGKFNRKIMKKFDVHIIMKALLQIYGGMK